MRISHAIRGAAASAVLAIGTLAGAPAASAHNRAKQAVKTEHVHRTTTRRRRTHRRHHGHGKLRCRRVAKRRPTNRRVATRRVAKRRVTNRRLALRCIGARLQCRVSVRHGSGCAKLPAGGRRVAPPKHRHRRHPEPAAPAPTATQATTPAPPPAPPAPPAPAPAAPATPQAAQPLGIAGSWTLRFDDEFNGSAINASVWNEHDGWTGQNNVTDHAANVSDAGGDATLTLASSGSGATIGTNQAVFGVGDFAEARVDFAGSGTTIYGWPAWWASGPNWPAAGENDIAEGLGTLTVNYHSPSGTHNQGTVPGAWAGAFHTYGIYRGSGYCDVYWDGQLVKRYSTDDNGQPEQLLFTTGAANTLQFGAAGEMLVDYVRVWAPA